MLPYRQPQPRGQQSLKQRYIRPSISTHIVFTRGYICACSSFGLFLFVHNCILNYACNVHFSKKYHLSLLLLQAAATKAVLGASPDLVRILHSIEFGSERADKARAMREYLNYLMISVERISLTKLFYKCLFFLITFLILRMAARRFTIRQCTETQQTCSS